MGSGGADPPAASPRNPALTVDGAVFCGAGAGLMVLLVERGRAPWQGSWALPGGFVDYGEDPDQAVNREVAEETGLTGIRFKQFRAYGRPDRDPRGHTVSVVYIGEVAGDPPAVVGGDDAARAAWYPVCDPPPLAFDHQRILDDILQDRQPSPTID